MQGQESDKLPRFLLFLTQKTTLNSHAYYLLVRTTVFFKLEKLSPQLKS